MITKFQIHLAPVEVGNNPPEDYVLAVTDAPKDYDGFGTIEIQRFDYPLDISEVRTKHNARVVLIRAEHLDWHQGRYGSGMYCCHTENVGDIFAPALVTETLMNRLNQRPELR